MEEPPLHFFTDLSGSNYFIGTSSGLFQFNHHLITKEFCPVPMATDSDSDLEAIFDDSFDSMMPTSTVQPEKKNKTVKKLFKYKRKALAIAHQGSLVFSLHEKGQSTSSTSSWYLECAKLQNENSFECVQNCLARIDSDISSTKNIDPWIFCLPGEVVSEKWADDESSSKHETFLFAFLPCSANTFRNRIFAVDNQSGDLIRTIEDTTDETFLNPGDVVTIFVKNRNLPNRLEGSSFMEMIRNRKLVDLSDHDEICLARDKIRDVKLFPDGFLLLLSTGKLFQYLKEGGKVSKHEVPLRAIHFIDYSPRTETCSAFTREGKIFSFQVPFKADLLVECSDKKEEKSSNLNPDSVVDEIVDNVRELEKVNRIKAKQEEVLAHLKLLMLLKTAKIEDHFKFSLKHSDSSLHLRVLNLSKKNVYNGKFWSVCVSATSPRKNPDLKMYQEFGLPENFGPDSRLIVKLENIRISDILCLPLAVEVCLNFKTRFGSKLKTASTNSCHLEEIGCLDVMECNQVHHQGDKQRPRVFSVPSKSDIESADFQSFVKNLYRRNGGGLLQEPELKEASKSFSFCQILPLEFFVRYDSKPVVAKLKDLASELEFTSSELKCDLLGQVLELRLEQNGRFPKLFCTCDSFSTLQAVKIDISNLKRELLEDDETISVPKKFLSYAHELKEDLMSLTDEDTEENRAILEQIYKRLRTNISSNLP